MEEFYIIESPQAQTASSTNACVCDTSPSMGGDLLNIAMTASCLLGEKVITFSENPKIANITDCVPLSELSWGYSIDIKKVVLLLLNEPIDKIYIFTDQAYTDAQFPNRYEKDYPDVAAEFEQVGKKVPMVYFWNLKSTADLTVDRLYEEQRLLLINGFSMDILQDLISADRKEIEDCI